MSRLVNLMHLGISRGWRVRFLNQKKVYSSSLIHCMLLYLLTRIKLFRSGFWLITYYIICSVKKYIIHIFFWKLPGVKKERIFQQLWTLLLQPAKGRSSKLLPLGQLHIHLGFTKFRNGRWWKFYINRTSKTHKVFWLGSNLQKQKNLLSFWVRSNHLIQFSAETTPGWPFKNLNDT